MPTRGNDKATGRIEVSETIVPGGVVCRAINSVKTTKYFYVWTRRGEKKKEKIKRFLRAGSIIARV